jgi:hypothetical protein
MRRVALIAVVCAAAACRISNQALTTGAVRGRLVGAQAGALVYVLGNAQVRVGAGDDGWFVLQGVPVGEAKLVAADASGGAAAFAAKVLGAEISDAGDVPMKSGAFLDAVLIAEGGADPRGALVTVEGTVFDGVRAGAGGALRLGPLPKGTFRVAVSARGYAPVSAEAGLEEGDARRLEMRLAMATATPRGCSASALACPSGTRCDDAGVCRECTDPAHCASDQGCDPETGWCLPATGRGLCAPCETDLHCGGAADRCLGTNGDRFCGRACLSETDCPRDFACAAGQCQPLATAVSCAAFAAAGHACTLADPAACGKGGECLLSAGSIGRCSVPCSSDSDCPASLACLSGKCR